jgi:hypothetical protein
MFIFKFMVKIFVENHFVHVMMQTACVSNEMALEGDAILILSS